MASPPLLELVSTERSYLATLGSIMTFYVEPWPLPDERDAVFLNVAALRELHIDMLEGFEAAAGDPELVRTVFVRRGAFLRLYIEFCNGFEGSAARLAQLCERDATLTAFLAAQKKASAHNGLDLNALLIAPIQRIPRYVLLLRAAVERHAELGPALALVEQIASEINEAKRERERSDKLGRLKFSPRRASGIVAVASRASRVVDGEDTGVGTPDLTRRSANVSAADTAPHTATISSPLMGPRPLGPAAMPRRDSRASSLSASSDGASPNVALRRAATTTITTSTTATTDVASPSISPRPIGGVASPIVSPRPFASPSASPRATTAALRSHSVSAADTPPLSPAQRSAGRDARAISQSDPAMLCAVTALVAGRRATATSAARSADGDPVAPMQPVPLARQMSRGDVNVGIVSAGFASPQLSRAPPPRVDAMPAPPPAHLLPPPPLPVLPPAAHRSHNNNSSSDAQPPPPPPRDDEHL